MASIVGVYNSSEEAKGALGKLLDTGFKFDNDNVSLIVSDGDHDVSVSGSQKDKTDFLIMGSAKGALFCSALAALIAGYTAIGNIIVLKKGLLPIPGHIVAAVSGAGAGAIAGGIIGLIISIIVAAYKAKQQNSKARAVVIVHTKDKNTTKAAEKILRKDNVPLKVAY